MGRRRASTANRHQRRVTLFVAALMAVAAAAIGLATPASAAGFGTIAGSVTASGGGPLAGIQMQLLNTAYGNTVATATTNASGAYTKGSFTGTYKVRFHDPSGVRADVYSGGATTFGAAATITINQGATTTVDASMLLGASIAGTVTLPGGGPAAGMKVEVVDGAKHTAASSVTAADGTYHVDGLPAGTFRVRFEDPAKVYAKQYTTASTTFAGATTYNTVGGTTSTANHAMVLAGQLSGRAAIGALGPGPAAGVVLVLDASVVEIVEISPTATDGTWTIGGLPPGNYKILYYDSSSNAAFTSGLRPMYLPNVDVRNAGVNNGFTAATVYAVSPSATTPTAAAALVGADCNPAIFYAGATQTVGAQAGKDLRGCTITSRQFVGSADGADFSYADLGSAAFGTIGWTSGGEGFFMTWEPTATIAGAKFRGASLNNAILDTPQFLSADHDWRGADLSRTSDFDFPGTWSCGLGCGTYVGSGQVLLSDVAFASAAPPYQLQGMKYDGISGQQAPTLERSNLQGLDLSGFSCAYCVLSDANLSNTNVTGANFANAIIPRVNLASATGLTGAQLAAAGTDWTGANLTGANLSAATLTSRTLANVNLTNANLSSTILTSSSLQGATVTGANLTNARVRSVNLLNAIGLTKAQLLSTQNDWFQLNVTGTAIDLSGSSLVGRIMQSANFTGANLTGANLTSVNLYNSNLTNANLTNVAFTSANLSYANLTGTTLTGATFAGATVDRTNFTTATGLSGAAITSANHNWTSTNFAGTNTDLSGVDFVAGGYTLTGVTFSTVNLTGANLSSFVLTNTVFTNANLTNANLTNTRFGSANLSGSLLTGATMTGTAITGTNLSGTTGLTAAQVSATGHNWLNTNFSNSGLDLAGYDFTVGGYTLNQANFSGLHLTGANFTGKGLGSVKFTGSNLTNTVFHNANLSYANLSGAVITGADFSGVTFTASNFSNLDLTGVSFANASLWYVNLSGSNVTGIDFTNADIRAVNLSNAIGLTRAQLASAQTNWNGVTLTGTGVDLSSYDFVTGAYTLQGTDFSGLDLHNALLTGRNLSGAKLAGSDLSGANLSGANAGSATFTGADLSGANVTTTGLSGAVISGVDFSGVTGLTSTQIYNANKNLTGTLLSASGVSFAGSTAPSGTKFDGAIINGLDFSNANLFSASMGNASAIGANFTGATMPISSDNTNFTNANFTNAKLVGVSRQSTYTGAVLTGAVMQTGSFKGTIDAPIGLTAAQLLATGPWTGLTLDHSTFLAGANLSGRDLSDVRIWNSDLTGVNLTNANLVTAYFQYSNLSGANVTGASISGMSFPWINFSNAIGLDAASVLGPNASFAGTNFTGTGIDFSGASVGGTIFWNSNMSGLNFSGAQLDGARFEQASLVGTNFAGASMGSWYATTYLDNTDLTNANLAGVTGSPRGASTATFDNTTCPDGVVTNGTTVLSCLGHGMSA